MNDFITAVFEQEAQVNLIELIALILILGLVLTLIFNLTVFIIFKLNKNEGTSEIEGFFTWLTEHFDYNLNTDLWEAKEGWLKVKLQYLYKLYIKNHG